jgi:hypothetical protein
MMYDFRLQILDCRLQIYMVASGIRDVEIDKYKKSEVGNLKSKILYG